LYKLRLISVDGILARTSKMAGTVLQSAKKHDVHQVTAEFWKKHTKKLKPDILKLVKEDDLIITACPRQILEGIIEQLPTKKFICSEVDMQIGDFTFLCARENKIKAFYEKYPNTSIDTFYTDSLNDKPLMELAHNVYLVR